MNRLYNFCRRALLPALVGAAGVPAVAGSIELLPLGDSITYGVGSDTGGLAVPVSPNHNLGGYRYYLSRSLGAGYDFVGNRSQGTGVGHNFTDNEHFGIPGGQASVTSSSSRPSTLRGLHRVDLLPTDTSAAFNPGVASPDAVLLHIGINSLPRLDFIQPYAGGTNDTADFANRREADVSAAATQFEELLDGTASESNGLIDRLTDPTLFASDAHLYVAFITPRTDTKDRNTQPFEKYLAQNQPSMVADYNSRVKAAIEARSDLNGRVTYVDLFSIRVDELDLNELAIEFYGNDDAQTIANLRMKISPFDDSLDGGADYVDWVMSGTFDEGEYANGAYDSNNVQLVAPPLPNHNDPTDLVDATNTDLMPDGLHPSNLGYAIIAQVWENAIVPEPSGMVLLLGGALLVGYRRPDRQQI